MRKGYSWGVAVAGRGPHIMLCCGIPVDYQTCFLLVVVADKVLAEHGNVQQ